LLIPGPGILGIIAQFFEKRGCEILAAKPSPAVLIEAVKHFAKEIIGQFRGDELPYLPVIPPPGTV